jgi:hypothetical protein
MEIKTLNFFGENGITSTSANHVANLAKEAVRNVHEKLGATRFYSETVSLLTGGNEAVVRKGMNVDAVEALPDLISQIAQANSLIAYLREAIKEKDRRMKEVVEYEETEARLALKAKKEYNFNNASPVKEAYPTEEQVKMTWSIGEQERYLSLEAEAAALGKFIHEDGHMSVARIDLMNKLNNPSKIDLNGSETVIHSYTPTVDIVTVDKVFNALQVRYRAIQAELNGMKKRVQDTIDAEKLRIDQEYARARREYAQRMKDLDNELEEIANREDVRRNELLKEVQNLKIVIPNRLRGIYDALTR